jgi:hypothetical protein
MVFNATFHNISAISWRLDLLVEETGKNHPPAASLKRANKTCMAKITFILNYTLNLVKNQRII